LAQNTQNSKQQQFEESGVRIVSQDVNVVALVKGDERYLFLFNDEQKGETLRTLGKYASNPELSFSWYDAAVLSQKVRRAVRKKGKKFQNTDQAVGDSDSPHIEYNQFEDFMGEEPSW